MSSKRIARPESAAMAVPDEIAYPSPRYFQVHFQHLSQMIERMEEQLQETNRQLAELKASQPIAPQSPRPFKGLPTRKAHFSRRTRAVTDCTDA